VNCSNRTEQLIQLNEEIIACKRCPRLIDYCAEIARVKRRAYLDHEYWGKPVPSFGDPNAWLLIIGLAPAAHGANRTGRVFTGDNSGAFLYRVLHRTGFASHPETRSRHDDMRLLGARITATAHCAPPQNKPSLDELRNCRSWLTREIDLLGNLRAVVALGKIAFDTYLGILHERGVIRRRSDFLFGHNRLHPIGGGQPVLISSYHPSQQNTNTGLLTEQMLTEVFVTARSFKIG
jgi:uracil-DNA glycosylase family 4